MILTVFLKLFDNINCISLNVVQDVITSSDFTVNIDSGPELNVSITIAEMEVAIKRIKTNKACFPFENS